MSLNTDQGFNALAVLVPAMGVIETMPDGIWKWSLLGLVCTITGIVCFKTKGDESTPCNETDEHAEIADLSQKGPE